MDKAISTIILAGGRSSRMGQDKALVEVGGGPLLRRTCEVALQCTSAVWVVTPRPQVYQAIVPPSCQLIAEQQADCGGGRSPGPLLGFVQGLAWVKTDWVLLLACDLPYLDACHLQRWQAQLTDATRAIAVLPKTEKGWEPLCGYYRTSCLPAITAFIEAGGRSFQVWLRQAGVAAIAWSADLETQQLERKMLFNCNTPDDLLEVQAELRAAD